MPASYSSNPTDSRGRFFIEEESTFRSPFHRDRDRIIHSRAFRRLKHKTQVFVEHEGDYFRTRLTHSIEVAQVARTIANVLGLNSELTEAVALAHDLGHPPFGHTGEEALNNLMASHGGFDHNAQAVRIVTSIIICVTTSNLIVMPVRRLRWQQSLMILLTVVMTFRMDCELDYSHLKK